MKKIKKILLLSLAILTIICFTSCSDKKSDSNLKEVSVVLDWYPNAVHSFIYDAIEKGYYEQEGLKVNIIFPSNANDAITLPAANKATLGVYYSHDVIQAVANQNIPVKSVGTIVQSPLNIVLSLKEKNISSPKDFVGKTIGYAGTQLSEEMIKSMMLSQNLDPNSVKLIDVGFELMTSMVENKVDATIGCFINHEVPQMEEEGFELNYFLVDSYGMPSYPELVFLTSDQTIENDKDTLIKFLKASKKGFEDMKNAPEETLDILLKNQNEENFALSKTVEQKSMDYLIKVMENEKASFLYQNKEDFSKSIDWAYNQGIINKKISADDIVVDLLD